MKKTPHASSVAQRSAAVPVFASTSSTTESRSRTPIASESLLVAPCESGHVDVRRLDPDDVAVDRIHQQQLAGDDESIAAECFDDRQRRCRPGSR